MFDYLGVNYWVALLLAPLLLVPSVSPLIFSAASYREAGSHLQPAADVRCRADHLRCTGELFGVSGLRYSMPEMFRGGVNLGFMFMPYYRAWVIVAALLVCFSTWFVIEKTKQGSYLRAGTEDSQLMQGFGINVPLLISLTYGFGVALAAFAGVLAAPIYSVTPVMGSATLITVFAVVVIGGSIAEPSSPVSSWVLLKGLPKPSAGFFGGHFPGHGSGTDVPAQWLVR